MVAAVQYVDLLGLESNKWVCLESMLAIILASSTAEDTFAQIIDGRPTRPSFRKNYGFCSNNSNISDQMDPSEQSIQAFKLVRAGLTPHILKLDVAVCIFL